MRAKIRSGRRFSRSYIGKHTNQKERKRKIVKFNVVNSVMKVKLSSVCDFHSSYFWVVYLLVGIIIRYLLSKFNVMVALLSPNSFLAVTLYLPASSTVTLLISRAAKYCWPSFCTDN